MLPYQKPTVLPLLYHLNSEPWLNVEAYNDPTAAACFKDMSAEGPAVPLDPIPRDSPLARLLGSRRSCREYEQRPLPLAVVSTLLGEAYGGLDAVPLSNGHLGLTRPVPSAGGLYPLELYLGASLVEGLADGLYHYNALHHRLEPLAKAGDLEHLAACFLGQDFLHNASLIVLIAGVFERCLGKYGPRGYRYMQVEAGHVGQNLCLAATELGLGTLCLGGFRDAALNRLLGLDGRHEAVLYCVGVGFPAGAPGSGAAR